MLTICIRPIGYAPYLLGVSSLAAPAVALDHDLYTNIIELRFIDGGETYE
jgi:hypothetical protein